MTETRGCSVASGSFVDVLPCRQPTAGHHDDFTALEMGNHDSKMEKTANIDGSTASVSVRAGYGLRPGSGFLRVRATPAIDAETDDSPGDKLNIVDKLPASSCRNSDAAGTQNDQEEDAGSGDVRTTNHDSCLMQNRRETPSSDE